MACRFVTAPNGQVLAVACGRLTRHACSTPGCSGNGTQQCDYPVTRDGKAGTCDRYICKGCAKRVGPNLDYCAAHARASKAGL